MSDKEPGLSRVEEYQVGFYTNHLKYRPKYGALPPSPIKRLQSDELARSTIYFLRMETVERLECSSNIKYPELYLISHPTVEIQLQFYPRGAR